ncbi:hypothetical protein TrVE_jg14171 [Triparma verrucosa]|uniref:Uncharacterized protein n=1 Tax=Triparma verrucosa TaxID=1606542 RepID=A0A9W7F002_9STRA|nr:hypothetical protein TrVE_jg14171 [Triparma verrucosa]
MVITYTGGTYIYGGTLTGGSMKVYRDGVATTDGIYSPYCESPSGSLVFANDQDDNVVNDPDQASGHYQSTVAIYNQAKSAEEIQDQAASTEIDALDPTLYALWADNTGTDMTGNCNTATLTSASVAGGPSEHVSVCNCEGGDCRLKAGDIAYCQAPFALETLLGFGIATLTLCFCCIFCRKRKAAPKISVAANVSQEGGVSTKPKQYAGGEIQDLYANGFQSKVSWDLSGQTPFTLECEIETSADAATIIAKPFHNGLWRNGGGQGQGKMLFLRGGRVNFDIGWVGCMNGRTNVSDNLRHKVALKFNKRRNKYEIYVDNKLDGDGLQSVPDHPETSVILGLSIDHQVNPQPNNGDMAPSFPNRLTNIHNVWYSADGTRPPHEAAPCSDSKSEQDLPVLTLAIYCPNCQRPTSKVKFCGSCGTQLDPAIFDKASAGQGTTMNMVPQPQQQVQPQVMSDEQFQQQLQLQQLMFDQEMAKQQMAQQQMAQQQVAQQATVVMQQMNPQPMVQVDINGDGIPDILVSPQQAAEMQQMA